MMIRKLCVLAAVAGALATPATADIYGQLGTTVKARQGSSAMLPPPGYRGQWWTSPDNCEYSRAGRPGEEIWYLIINTAHKGCAIRLIGRAFNDYN